MPIYRRELKSYVTSPALYALAALWFFLLGLIFYQILNNFVLLSGSATARRELGVEKVNYTVHVVGQCFFAMHFLLIVLVPMLTMRLIAEEKRTGTFEVLKSLPFTDHSIVTAKFLAAFTLVSVLILGSVVHIGLMYLYGRPELPVILVAYAGTLLAAAGYIAIGVFCSALTENQIVAAITGFVLILMLFLVGEKSDSSSGWSRFFEQISLRYHTDQFHRGLLRIEDVAYFVLMIIAFLFLTCRLLELRRWKV